jgi:protein gp37
MNKTQIEWADWTWNPWIGCRKLGGGCLNCYAAARAVNLARHPNERIRDAYRQVSDADGWTGSVKLLPHKLTEPLSVRSPSTVFVASMSDPGLPNIPPQYLDRALAVIAVAGTTIGHAFYALTKRPRNVLRYLTHPEREHRVRIEAMALVAELADRRGSPVRDASAAVSFRWPLGNLAWGVSLWDAASVEHLAADALEIPAAAHVASCEPLLGPLDLRPYLPDAYSGHPTFDAVIAGAETGPSARAMRPDWARRLRDDCAEARIPFFFKRDSSGERHLDGRLHYAMCLKPTKGLQP